MIRSRETIQHTIKLMINCGAALLGLGCFLLFGPQIESTLRGPVIRHFNPTEWRVEGKDVVVTGLMTKWWPCDFVPPISAFDQSGGNYSVASRSQTAQTSWPALRHPRSSGLGGLSVGQDTPSPSTLNMSVTPSGPRSACLEL